MERDVVVNLSEQQIIIKIESDTTTFLKEDDTFVANIEEAKEYNSIQEAYEKMRSLDETKKYEIIGRYKVLRLK